MTVIDTNLLARLLTDINKVTFYKRDAVTSDLICCDLAIGENVWTFDEELVGWDLLMGHLQELPGFRGDWFSTVSQPTFSPCETVAFRR